jgi:hypothetical protein
MAELSDLPINEVLDNGNTQQETFPLLPRQAWNSQLAYLKQMLKAKQALDRVEK